MAFFLGCRCRRSADCHRFGQTWLHQSARILTTWSRCPPAAAMGYNPTAGRRGGCWGPLDVVDSHGQEVRDRTSTTPTLHRTGESGAPPCAQLISKGFCLLKMAWQLLRARFRIPFDSTLPQSEIRPGGAGASVPALGGGSAETQRNRILLPPWQPAATLRPEGGVRKGTQLGVFSGSWGTRHQRFTLERSFCRGRDSLGDAARPRRPCGTFRRSAARW